ncbi:MAG: hypothetical protein RMJ38_04390, partial [candidate division WOR-3 bacterium]|nr:hypothetical protein [candidate division WOR-3 bacterium]MDW8150659.1 hypothetical protein [candidate division WOR-3 bacterium]
GELALFIYILNLILSFTSSFYGSFSYLVGSLKYKIDNLISVAFILTLFFVVLLFLLNVFFKYPYFQFLILAFVFANIIYYFKGIAYGVDEFKLVNIIINFPSILTFIITYLFLIYKKDINLAIVSQVLGFIVVFIYTFPKFAKYFRWNFSIDVLRKIFSHGIFIGLSTATTYLLYRIDFFILERFLSKAEIGIYSIAISIGEINFIVLSFILSAITGKFFSEDSKRILKQSIFIIWAFQIVVISLFLVFGKFFIELVFGREFLMAYIPSLFILISTAIYNPSSIIAVYINVKIGKSYIPFLIALFSLIFKSIIAFFLIKSFSIVGASISCLISYTLTFSIYALVYFKLIKN